MPLLSCENLAKSFSGKVAVKSLSFSMMSGESVALIGPNGAGKSTALSMLTGLLRPDHGCAVIDGYNAAENPKEIRKHIGVLFQEFTLDEHMSAKQTLEFHAALYGVRRREVTSLVSEALQWSELEAIKHQKVGTLSGGMKRRLEIARAALHKPSLLILDEPTLGLDPKSRIDLWDRIETLKMKGTAVLLTTHILGEAESCERIGILSEGEIIAFGTKNSILAEYSKHPNESFQDVFLSLTRQNDSDEIKTRFPKLIRTKSA